MSCVKMESRILAYMDGRLRDSERGEMEKHLAACAACRVRANEFRSVSDLLGELPMVEPTPAFDVRVRARVAAEPVGVDAPVAAHCVCRIDAIAGDAVDWIPRATGGAAADKSGRSGCFDDAGHFGDGRSRYAGEF